MQCGTGVGPVSAGAVYHIGLAIHAFLGIEHEQLLTGTRWFGTKIEIIRIAIPTYLTWTRYTLAPTAYLL